MTAQKGSAFLLKVGDGATPTENFTTVAGLRTTKFTLNNQRVDSTNKDSGAWRALLDGAGVRSVSISGAGVFTDAASEETVRGFAFGNNIKNYRISFGNGDYMTGPFQITAYERAGNYDGEESYSLTLESAGTVTFTAV